MKTKITANSNNNTIDLNKNSLLCDHEPNIQKEVNKKETHEEFNCKSEENHVEIPDIMRKNIHFVNEKGDLFDYFLDLKKNFINYFPNNNAKNIIGKMMTKRKKKERKLASRLIISCLINSKLLTKIFIFSSNSFINIKIYFFF